MICSTYLMLSNTYNVILTLSCLINNLVKNGKKIYCLEISSMNRILFTGLIIQFTISSIKTLQLRVDLHILLHNFTRRSILNMSLLFHLTPFHHA